jgi:O-methyltransferase
MSLRAVAARAKQEFFRRRLSPLGRRVLEQRLTYLVPSRLYRIEACASAANRDRITGDFIECGVALGGSAILLASLSRNQRRFQGFDLFGMIPPPSERDDRHAHERYQRIKSGASDGIGGDRYYGYVDNLFDQVRANFETFGLAVDGRAIALQRGLFEETLHATPGRRIAFAHVDCDWHDPVKHCLDVIYEMLSPGGFIILDDYSDYAGCRQAADNFMSRHKDMKLVHLNGSAVLRRALDA